MPECLPPLVLWSLIGLPASRRQFVMISRDSAPSMHAQQPPIKTNLLSGSLLDC